MRQIAPCRPKWPGTITDRARFVGQLLYQPVDRCFNMEFGFWKENFEQWPLFRNHGIRNNDEADAFFNFDRVAQVGGKLWMHPPFAEEVVSETSTTRTLKNADGLIVEVPKDGHSTIPRCVGSSIRCPDDWERVKEERFRPDDPARRLDTLALQKRHPSDRDYPLGVNCGSMIGKIRDMLTVEGLAYACYDYPDMVEDMVETACVLVERALDQLLPHIDFDFATGWEDICCNTGPLVSIDFFKNIIVPRYKRIGARLKAAGIRIWWTDCDGNIRPLIPSFLEAGINCMFPFEVRASGHPSETLDKYGPAIRIVGGVDKMALRAGREAIRAYMESIAPFVERGGFIPHCDHRCPPDVKHEDYLYYLDLKERMFGSCAAR